MRKIYRISIIALIMFAMISCQNRKSGSFAENQRQEKPVVVMIEEVKPADLDKYIRVSGKLEGSTDVNMISEVSGKIITVHKKLGDWMEAGESLASIDNSDYQNQLRQAESSLLAAEANLESAEMQMKISAKLYESEKISESEYLRTTSAFKAAEASLKGAAAQLASIRKILANSQFTAPVSGFISELNLQIGDYVAMGRVIANLVDSRKLRLKSGVGELDITALKKGDKAVIFYQGEEFPATVSGIGIKPVTGGNFYPVETELKNKDNKLLPGMIVEARILSGTYRNVVFTSITNLREKYDQSFVYVINAENRAELRMVELGEKIGKNVIILSGMQTSDKLVIDGIDSLIDGSLVEVKTGFNNNNNK